jgi:hypothetical protein
MVRSRSLACAYDRFDCFDPDGYELAKKFSDSCGFVEVSLTKRINVEDVFIYVARNLQTQGLSASNRASTFSTSR